jgi:hypothetical protein
MNFNADGTKVYDSPNIVILLHIEWPQVFPPLAREVLCQVHLPNHSSHV